MTETCHMWVSRLSPLQAHQRKIRVSIPQARKTGEMESLGLYVIVIGLAEAVRNGRLT